jgi:hypothetical protein
MGALPELRPVWADLILAEWPEHQGGRVGVPLAYRRPPSVVVHGVSHSAGKTGAILET